MRAVSIILSVSLLLSGCLQQQRPRKPSRSGALDTGPKRLVFTKIAVAEKDKLRIGMSERSLLYADDTMPLIHLTDSGISTLFQTKEGAWGLETHLDEQAQFQQAYHLPGLGWLGLAADAVQSVSLVDRSLTRFSIPFVPRPESILGAGFDFVGFHQDNALQILEVKDGKANIRELPLPLSPLKSLQKCTKVCQYWGFDGQRIHVLPQSNRAWLPLKIELEFPQGSEPFRLAGKLSLNDKGWPEVSGLYALGKNLELYAAEGQGPETRLPTWENVAGIVQQSCLGCHGSDGFDQANVLAGLKSELLRRVDPKRRSEAGAMPPSTSMQAQSFTQADAELILAWLETVSDSKDPGDAPGKPMDPPPVDPNAPITGELKRLADSYCVSCHTDNQKLEWWVQRKLDAKARVESGDMPRNREMPAAERSKLIELIQAL